MREIEDIEAARWFAQYSENWDIEPHTVSHIGLPSRDDYWHIRTIRTSETVIDLVRITVERMNAILSEHLNPDVGYHGFTIDPSVPYRIDRELTQLAEITTTAEPILQRSQAQLDHSRSQASYGRNSVYELIARDRLRLMKKVIPNLRLFMHAQLWLFWISKSINQAKTVSELITEHGYYEEAGEHAYGFFAFPPLLTASISCTAVLEEVGAQYVNTYRDEDTDSIETDNTNCSTVLRLLKKVFPDASDFDMAKIEEEVVDSRDTFAHYMIDRQHRVDIESFENFVEGVAEAFWLIRRLAWESIFRPFHEIEGKMP